MVHHATQHLLHACVWLAAFHALEAPLPTLRAVTGDSMEVTDVEATAPLVEAPTEQRGRLYEATSW
jgi:hypothetical protein